MSTPHEVLRAYTETPTQPTRMIGVPATLYNAPNHAGRDLYVHRQAIDTRTPSGRAMFQMLGVFAEFARAMIQERVRAGMARAREKGTRSGRPIGRRRTSPVVESRIRRERREGHGVLKIARKVGVGVSVVQRVLAAT